MRFDVPVFAEERRERLASLPSLRAKAARGDVAAQIDLAWELAEGEITEADFVEASRLFELASATGDENARLNRARFLQLRRVPDGIRELRFFAAKGNYKAQFWLGRYYQGMPGRQNQRRAAIWYKRSHRGGSTGGEYAFLGQLMRLAPIYLRPFILAKGLGKFMKLILSSNFNLFSEDELLALTRKLKRRGP